VKVVNISQQDSYYTQRNNKLYPHVACTPTSYVMGLDVEGLKFPGVPDGTQPEDYLMKQLRGPSGHELLNKLTPWFAKHPRQVPPNEIHLVVAALINILFGREVCRWYSAAAAGGQGGFTWLRDNLDEGHPCVVSGGFGGLSGHTLVVVGYAQPEAEDERDDTAWVLDDPYGNPADSYKSHKGNDILYPADLFALEWAGHGATFRKDGF
jgi:hypothetical protein